MRIMRGELEVAVGTYDELSRADQYLLDQAKEVRDKAHAPYSHYRVGSAVREKSGITATGCNVEVYTYTQTGHAETNAIANLVAQLGPEIELVAVAVVGGSESESMAWPPVPESGAVTLEEMAFCCGNCLATIGEFVSPAGVKLIDVFRGHICQVMFANALPVSFQKRHLMGE
ncbi:MAG: hypothetical protein Q7S31_01460 [bacterium]|nr:hypothetical protein [bacterium]